MNPIAEADPSFQNNDQTRLALLRQARPFWWAMAGLLGSSLLLLLLFAAPAVTTPVPLAPQRLVYLTLALSCACAGSLIGFLFGIPNTEQPKRDLMLKAPATSGTAGPTDEPSTNLEQVSDWLTKIIIGVGLVEANRLVHALARLGSSVQATTGGSAVVPQFITVTFGVLGFSCGYIWTRLYYGSLQMTLDFNLRRYLSTLVSSVHELKNQSDQTDVKVANLGQAQEQQDTALDAQKNVLTEVLANKNTSTALAPTSEITRDWAGQIVKSLPEDVLANLMAGAPTTSPPPELPPDAKPSPALVSWQAKLQEFMAAPVDEQANPTAVIFGKLPASLPDRQLTVSLVATLMEGVYFIKAQVAGTVARPLQGKVTFLLHPTYSVRAVEVRVDARPPGGSAAYSFSARGSFTLIAMTDDAETILAYDLATLPDVPPGW